jgi:hypothetical protein
MGCSVVLGYTGYCAPGVPALPRRVIACTTEQAPNGARDPRKAEVRLKPSMHGIVSSTRAVAFRPNTI